MTFKMENNLYIIGAGGFAREIYDYLSKTEYEYENYKLIGFLDDNVTQLDSFNTEHSIVGALFNNNIPEGSTLIMGIANPNLKEKIYNFYNHLGIKFITYIHHSAVIGSYVEVADGCVICPNATLTTNIKIGLCTTINAHSSIGHDACVGDFSTLSGHCDITGGVIVGNRVLFGSHVTVIPSKIIESDSIVGAGSVVIKKVKSGSTVFGNPAKKIN